MRFYPRSERDALVILNAVPSIGNRTIQRLREYYSSASGVFGRSPQEWSLDGILSPVQIKSLEIFPAESFLEAECKKCEQNDIYIICDEDAGYPSLLREIPDAPVLLYIRGDLDVFNFPGIGIVGSRKASVYGHSLSRQLAVDCARSGLVIISGLARGIDTAAHQGSLAVRGKTVAVLGSGLLCVYPSQNLPLAKKIVANQGALVSEFPLDSQPLPYHFPRRNRIISGLAQGVIVVEAALRSGALITADFALEQGRDIYALPGKIDNPSARGTLELIKQGAKMVTCAEDILEDFRDRFRQELRETQDSVIEDLGEDVNLRISDSGARLLNDLPNHRVHFNEICHSSRLSANRVATLLTQMEMQHQIEQFPGKYFQRISHG